MIAKTSQSHPLQIAEVVIPGHGSLGLTFCPGKRQANSLTGPWHRDLDVDLDAVRAWGADAVVTLMESHELDALQVEGMGDEVRKRGMTWFHLPIVDVDVPTQAFEEAWHGDGGALREILAGGGKVLLHCKGGLGRTGTIAARLLVETGMSADRAVRIVREVRPGAIETRAQEAYARATKAVPSDRAARKTTTVGGGQVTDAVRDRARGALLGLAVGDALGTTIEFSRRDSKPKQTELTGGGPFELRPGEWTDDTSMALALADSLIACGDLDPVDLGKRFVQWWKEGAYSCTGGCFDIGLVTRSALGRFIRTGDPNSGSADEESAGNGSLMRLAPVALHAWSEPERLADIAAVQSRVTHGAPQAVQACVWFADLLRRAIVGEEKAALLTPTPWGEHEAIRAVTAGSWRMKERDAVRSTGYVVDTLEAALWAVDRTQNFEEAVVLAVNLGDDADTVGAVTGQIAGAIYGRSAIPPRWLERLAWGVRIEGMVDALLAGRDG